MSVTGTANVSTTLGVQGAVTFAHTLGTGNTTVNGFVSIANTLGATGAVTFANTLAVTGATTLSNTLSVAGATTLQSDVVLAVYANTDLGSANNTTSVEIFSFPTATYAGAKMTAKIVSLSGANTQVQELIIAQNTTDVVLTAYGTVSAPSTANLGAFSASINSTAVSVRFTQTGANSSVKVFTQLIK